MKVPKTTEKPIDELTPSTLPIAPGSPLTWDGTSHGAISTMMNRKYSEEIITGVAGAYNFGKLMALKVSDWKTFLVEAEYQIKGLWHGMEALSVHNDLFRVKLQIAMGKILNVVKGSFKKHSDFTAWVKATFPDKTMRYFQQARQLDRMGDFARIYASIGKNRLLELTGSESLSKRTRRLC